MPTKRKPPKPRPVPREGGLLLTARQAAELIGFSPAMLRKWAARGDVPHLRLGSYVWFPRQQLIEWIERKTKMRARK